MSELKEIKVNEGIIGMISDTLDHNMVWGKEGISPLKFFREGQQTYLSTCPNPEHDSPRPSFLMRKGWNTGKCQRCGYTISWLEFIMDKLGVGKLSSGSDFWKALGILAEKAGYSIDISNIDLGLEKTIINQWRQEILRDQLAILFKKEFQERDSSRARTVREYFEKNAISSRTFSVMPFGYYPSQVEVKDYLLSKGFTEKIIEQAQVLFKDFEEGYNLIYIYNSRRGNVSGFKAFNPDEPDSWKFFPTFTPELQKEAMLGFELSCGAIQNEKTVMLVEDELDCFILQHEIFKNTKNFEDIICFPDMNIVDKSSFEMLKELGCKIIYFLFPTKKESTEKLKKCLDALIGLDLESFVISVGKDIDSLRDIIAMSGTEALIQLVHNRSKSVTSGNWLGGYLLSNHNLKDESQFKQARKVAVAYSLQLNPTDSKDFLYFVGEALDWDPHFWSTYVEQFQRDLSKKSLQEEIKKLTEQLDLKKKDDMEIGFSWAADFEEAGATVSTISEEEIQRAFYDPGELVSFYEGRKKGIPIGLTALDKNMDLLKNQFIVISGRSSSGKTSLALHFVKQILKKSKELVIFITYDDSRLEIFNKLLSNFSEIPYHMIIRKQLEDFAGYYDKYLSAIEEFTEFRDQFVVIQEPVHRRYTVSDISEICATIRGNVPIGLIVIDPLQMVSWDQSTSVSNDTEMGEIAKELKRLSMQVECPIIGTLNSEFTLSGRGGEKLIEAEIPELPWSVKQHCSVILGLSRISLQHRGESEKIYIDKKQTTEKVQIYWLKNVYGELPTEPLTIGFIPEFHKFIELED
ncbi:hypothetical protein KKB18_01510 [bacterium]|nr:hypothetical protein [bacterium]